MLVWAIIFLVLAIGFGFLGLNGIAVAMTPFSKFSFISALIFFLIALIFMLFKLIRIQINTKKKQ